MPAATIFRRQQTGAALIVSLILLMVLTLLAVSTLRTASLELLMAGNTQYRENAFRLAQSGIDAVVDGVSPPAGLSACPAAVADAPVVVPGLGGRYVTETCAREESICTGSSLTCFNFEVTSTGTTDQRDARVRLVQGFALLGVSE